MALGIKRRLNVFIYGIFAGIAIAIGGILFLLATAYVPSNIIEPKLVGSFLFPVGLLLVCYFKMNLYTGKVGIAFHNPKLDKKGLPTFTWLLWIIFGNLVGAVFVGLIMFVFAQGKTAFADAINNAGRARIIPLDAINIYQMAYKSTLCGILVYLAIYFFNSFKNHIGKVLGIIFPIALFVYGGFQHCVANMFYLTAAGAWNINSIIGLLICILFNSLGALAIDLLMRPR